MKKILMFSGQNDFLNVKLSELRESDFAFICGQEMEIVKDRTEMPKLRVNHVSKNEIMQKISKLIDDHGTMPATGKDETDRLLEQFFPEEKKQ